MITFLPGGTIINHVSSHALAIPHFHTCLHTFTSFLEEGKFPYWKDLPCQLMPYRPTPLPCLPAYYTDHRGLWCLCGRNWVWSYLPSIPCLTASWRELVLVVVCLALLLGIPTPFEHCTEPPWFVLLLPFRWEKVGGFPHALRPDRQTLFLFVCEQPSQPAIEPQTH